MAFTMNLLRLLIAVLVILTALLPTKILLANAAAQS